MIEYVDFEGEKFPKWQSNGNAARFILPFAKEVCKGNGLDIGAGNPQWAFPGSKIIDPKVTNDGFEAMKLPDNLFDYIFSSHTLEHLPNWVSALDYWGEHLKENGVMFLYLPHPDQTYWLPWNNKKHVHVMDPEILYKYFVARGYTNVLISGMDLNFSFSIIAER